MTTGPRRCRLAMVVQHPIHYHIPLYRAVSADPDIDLDVLYCQAAWSTSGFDPEVNKVVDWGTPLFDGYCWRIFRNLSPRRDGIGFWKFVNPGLFAAVLTGPYDAVYVHGCNHFTHVAAMLAAKLGGKRLVFRTDSYNLGERSPAKRLLRRLIYGTLFRLVDVALYVGRHNRDFYRDAGVPERRLVHAPQVVDNDYFTAAAKALAPRRDEIRAAFGIPPGRRVILFSSKFMAKKQPLRLIEAFATSAARRDWTLLMVGDGELLPAARALVDRLGIAEVVFTGFLDQKTLPRAYTCADIMVLPSAFQETWGLVVPEAMNFGCAMIVSDRVGCAPDLVADICGLIVPWDDTAALTAAIDRLALDEALRGRFAAGGRARVARWGVPEYVAGLRRALGLPDRVAVGGAPPEAGQSPG
ncbi:MAG: glycosyltransferase family 4 protein [Alphaproteobacteria bacterium]